MATTRTRTAAAPSPPSQSAKLPSESGLVGFWYLYIFFTNSNSNFFFVIRWFEFRNDDGQPAALSLKDIELIHNYGLKYLSEGKFTASYWTSAPPLAAIKPKFEAYLKGIDHRTNILKETPRKEAKRGEVKITVKGFFKKFQPSKTYQMQTQSEIPIELIMDEGTCGVYGDGSRAMAQKIDDHSKENIEALVALAVMELQFFRGCDVEWKTKDDKTPSQAALSDGADDRDDDEEDENEFDFTRIDSTDVLSDETLKELRYPNPDKFVKHRECFALAMLMFLSEDLSCKLADLSGQVHAGWKKAFGKPIDFEQILNIPDALKTAFEFTEEEQDWLEGTVKHFVSAMTVDQLEDLGITDEHLEELEIPKPVAVRVKAKRKAAPGQPRGTKAKAGAPGKVKPPH
jgi:hypothetical protein